MSLSALICRREGEGIQRREVPEELHARVLKIVLQLPAAWRSGGSRRALAGLAQAGAGAVGLVQAWDLLSAPARADRRRAVEQGRRSRAGIMPAASPAHPRLGETLLLPLLLWFNTRVTVPQRGEFLAHGCVACPRLSGVVPDGPGPVESWRDQGTHPSGVSGPATSSPWSEDIPLDRGGGST